MLKCTTRYPTSYGVHHWSWWGLVVYLEENMGPKWRESFKRHTIVCDVHHESWYALWWAHLQGSLETKAKRPFTWHSTNCGRGSWSMKCYIVEHPHLDSLNMGQVDLYNTFHGVSISPTTYRGCLESHFGLKTPRNVFSFLNWILWRSNPYNDSHLHLLMIQCRYTVCVCMFKCTK